VLHSLVVILCLLPCYFELSIHLLNLNFKLC